MQWTGLNELREKYLSFFEGKGHLRLDSFPLVPKDDPSLLLINSGMAPMKKWFLAQEEPPRHRVTTCQKCIRTPDIERVGITARHGTFFEMLGNFSFQDYFKEEVIPWAWEFLTSDEWMAIPKDRLHISVYEEDDEAYDIWTKKVGIAPDHMVRLGKEDNFWEHGSGPCGPCSEIYFDRGPEYGCGKPTCGVGCDCDRYMEIWNLVFSQFDADGKGHYERLARPNIDTGMGLERLACVMQGVGNLFEVDTVQSVLHHVVGGDAHLLGPDIVSLVVLFIHRDVQAVLRNGHPLVRSQELPCPGNDLFFEVILEGEVAQHFKEGAVAGSDANALDIRGADALLAGGHAVTGRLFLSQKPLFHRCHAAVDEQQAGVVLGHQREAVQTQVALALKEAQVLFTQFIQTGPLHRFSLLDCPWRLHVRFMIMADGAGGRRKQKTAPSQKGRGCL